MNFLNQLFAEAGQPGAQPGAPGEEKKEGEEEEKKEEEEPMQLGRPQKKKQTIVSFYGKKQLTNYNKYRSSTSKA